MTPWNDISHIETEIAAYLSQVGRVFRVFADHDSGCTSVGVWVEGRRWFVKHSNDPRGIASLRRAIEVHRRVQHPALPALVRALTTPEGLALVHTWVPGEPLRLPSRTPPEKRRDPTFAPVRFRALPLSQVLAALDAIYDVHLRVADAGLIAVDFYDGCLLYDFEGAQLYVCDLDEYRPGPFVLDADRLPGSGRFMAPEEFQRGAVIDQTTNVYTMGRTAVLLLGDGQPRETTQASLETWRGTPAMEAVVRRATDPDRAVRHPTVRAFVQAWRQAAGRWEETPAERRGRR